MKNILFIALLFSATHSFGDDSFRVVGIHDGGGGLDVSSAGTAEENIGALLWARDFIF